MMCACMYVYTYVRVCMRVHVQCYVCMHVFMSYA